VRTDESRHYAADGRRYTEQMRDGRRVEQFVLKSVNEFLARKTRKQRTGTFLWVTTTEVSFPRTAMAVWPEPEMALKAYSGMECWKSRYWRMVED
jgi:hypothetical protein